MAGKKCGALSAGRNSVASGSQLAHYYGEMWANEFLDGSLPLQIRSLVYPVLIARLRTIEELGRLTDDQVMRQRAGVTVLLSRDADYIRHFGGASVLPSRAPEAQTREQAISRLEASGQTLLHALLQAWSSQEPPTEIMTLYATSYEALAYTLMEDETLLRQEWLMDQ